MSRPVDKYANLDAMNLDGKPDDNPDVKKEENGKLAEKGGNKRPFEDDGPSTEHPAKKVDVKEESTEV